MTTEMTQDVIGCARCLGTHIALKFKALTHPSEIGAGRLTHWAICPASGEPISLGTWPKPEAPSPTVEELAERIREESRRIWLERTGGREAQRYSHIPFADMSPEMRRPWIDIAQAAVNILGRSSGDRLYGIAAPDENSIVIGQRETSRKAALNAYPRTGTQRARVLALLRVKGTAGMTRWEIEHAMGLSGNSIHPRVLELIAGGFAAETDRTRKTPSGNDAAVVVATEKGLRKG